MIWPLLFLLIAIVFAVANLHGTHCGWGKAVPMQWSDVWSELFLGLFWPIGLAAMSLDLVLTMRADKRKREIKAKG